MTTRLLTPFTAKSTAAEVVAGIDLTGYLAIVTGGASGIGIETARARSDPVKPAAPSQRSRARRPPRCCLLRTADDRMADAPQPMSKVQLPNRRMDVPATEEGHVHSLHHDYFLESPTWPSKFSSICR
jgi:hypothetical protein